MPAAKSRRDWRRRRCRPCVTPRITKRVERFYLSVAEIFEAWVSRRESAHAQRAYRQDVIALVRHLGIMWPDEATSLRTVSVGG